MHEIYGYLMIILNLSNKFFHVLVHGLYERKHVRVIKLETILLNNHNQMNGTYAVILKKQSCSIYVLVPHIGNCTVCPGSSDPIYIVSYYI